ncbi:hypothetical protein ACIRL0_36150 [Streptomyces sp. NPDC102365]|uniref:hypothetical protein n=1 Tax=Streptomyces sp. NPDC102365 TaxID=3366162 RepID=UPI0037F15729
MIYSSGSCDDLPEHARPDGYLAPLSATPTEWVTVLGRPLQDSFDWGISSYLTRPESRAHALQEYTGTQAMIGSAGISTFYPEKRTVFEEGLRDEEEHAEFFVQLRSHHGLAEPTLEFTPSFLWYFDAIPRNDGSWYYLDDAGRDHELVRTRRTETELRIDIAALPLRRYLAVRSRLLVIQHDRITRLDPVPEPNIDAVDRSDVRHFAFHSGDIHSLKQPGFVRLVGKQIVLPIDAAPADLARPHTSERRFLEFTVAIDPSTGERITSTCDPAKLSNYFTDRGTPHYLTRVYFRRDVLNRYTSQPSRYRIENDRLSCLGLWGISIGTNPDGFIEVYLGDLGRDLPAEERDHWRSFNVPPGGGRDEGRFDRDILGRWTDGPPDPLRRLFAAREHLGTALGALLGQEVYKSWHPADQIAFEGLHMPTSSEQHEADTLILLLAKGVIDYLAVKALRRLPGVTDSKAQSINCLEAWVSSSGGDSDTLIRPLRILQGLRSTGPAHLRGKDWHATLTRAGLDGLRPDAQFVQVLALTGDALHALALHAESQHQTGQ